MEQTTPKPYTYETLAEYLTCSTRYLKTLKAEGKIQHSILPGGLVRFTQEHVNNFLKTHSEV